MRKYLLIAFILNSLWAIAQDAKLLKGSMVPLATLKFSDNTKQDWNTRLQNIREAPKHIYGLEEKKALLARLRRANHNHPEHKELRSAAPMPVILDTFPGNPPQAATPPDNTMAISNAGIIVSCVNTQMMIMDTTGAVISSNSLSYFANQLGFYNAISDPKVIYDPTADQFIVLFFSGSTSTNTHIIVAFTENNDPTSYWSFYDLSGNLLNDSTWSDFPVISLTQSDLFVTFNHLQTGYYFPEGFRYSVIWQIDKNSGYNYDTIRYNYWHDIVYQGVPIWNIATVEGGSSPAGPNAYFLSVRPHDLTNDTVFLHQISNSYASGVAQFSSQVLTTSTPYGLPPDAPQLDGQTLATNDARILSAIIQNDKIQYVENTVDPTYGSAGVYVGTISNVSTAPVASGQILSYDTMDLGYPSIAYIGNGANDDRALITCSYLPAHGYPGTGAFYIDNTGTTSDMLHIKEGLAPVYEILDSQERWGDYTTIQKRYNVPNTAWLSGSYTDTLKQYETWIASILNTESALGVPAIPAPKAQSVYPNPAKNDFTVNFDLSDDTWCRFTLVNAAGQVVRMLLEDEVDAGTNQFSFNTAYLSSGMYYLHITSGNDNILTKPVVIAR